MSTPPPGDSEPFKHIQRHPKYYISDGDLHLLVDGVLFCVHSFFFKRDSQIFRDLLNIPIGPNLPRPGSSDSTPIRVKKTTSPFEFEKFLWVFYNETYSDYTATITEWTSILKIACEYDFLEVKNCAIRGLQQCELSIVQRIYIYQLYALDIGYLIPLYIELCARDEAPTDDEVEHLGSKTSLLIFRLREQLRSTAGAGGKSPLPDGVDKDDALEIICRILQVDKTKIHIPSGSLRRRPRMTLTREDQIPMPMGRARRETLDQGTREVYVYGDYICHGPEGCRPVVLGASSSDDVFEEKIPGHFEVGQVNLKDIADNMNHLLAPHIGIYRNSDHTIIIRSNGASMGFFVVLPVRTFLFLVAFAWTLTFFWLLQHTPSDLRLL